MTIKLVIEGDDIEDLFTELSRVRIDVKDYINKQVDEQRYEYGALAYEVLNKDCFYRFNPKTYCYQWRKKYKTIKGYKAILSGLTFSAKKGQWGKNLTFDQFIKELTYHNGGIVGSLEMVGEKTIDQARSIFLLDNEE